jgi:uncharacterized protein
VVKAGDVVKVKVLEIDVPRKRVALTMRLSDAPPKTDAGQKSAAKPVKRTPAPAPAGGALAEALAKALRQK